MSLNLPTPTRNAEAIAQVATGVGAALAAIWFPPAALAPSIIDRLIKRWVRKPERMLVEAVKAGGIENLNDEQVVQFVPMAYAFFEAAKRGEYERNLRILAAFITDELKQPVVDAGSVTRVTRRLEAISETELRVLVLAHDVFERGRQMEVAKVPGALSYIEAASLATDPANRANLSAWAIKIALSELESRGFLVADGATRWGKVGEHYHATAAMNEIMARAADVMTLQTDPVGDQN